MKRNTAASEKTAGRITIAYLERDEVVRGAVVSHIDCEGDFRFTNLGSAGEVGLISVEGQTHDLHRVE